jgi:hypothetical protein
VQILYTIEQGNKSDEQGDKIDDQGIKSAEHGMARQVRSGRLRRPSVRARRLPAAVAGWERPCSTTSTAGPDPGASGDEGGPAHSFNEVVRVAPRPARGYGNHIVWWGAIRVVIWHHET